MKKKGAQFILFTCFGCKAIVRLPRPKIKKLGEKRTQYIFLG